MDCQRIASYRIDVVKDTGPDHMFCCRDHLSEMLIPVLKVSRGSAARVCVVPATNEEPCEVEVE